MSARPVAGRSSPGRATGRSRADIAPERLAALNAGAAETTTLVECLAMDFAALMRACLPEVGEAAAAALDRARDEGITRRMALAAQVLAPVAGEDGWDAWVTRLQGHPADTIRGWACYLIGARPGLSLTRRLERIRPLADDPHFGVREWAWMAVRPHLAADPEAAVAALRGWTADPSERLRRFASEALRPRGVWCAHIAALRRTPEIALPVLEPLRSDPAAYVGDSVGNWLNDASKDRPDWVRALCRRWSAESPTAETARICKRALRTLDRAG